MKIARFPNDTVIVTEDDPKFTAVANIWWFNLRVQQSWTKTTMMGSTIQEYLTTIDGLTDEEQAMVYEWKLRQ